MEKLKKEYLEHLRVQAQLSVSQLQKQILFTHPKQVDE